MMVGPLHMWLCKWGRPRGAGQTTSCSSKQHQCLKGHCCSAHPSDLTGHDHCRYLTSLTTNCREPSAAFLSPPSICTTTEALKHLRTALKLLFRGHDPVPQGPTSSGSCVLPGHFHEENRDPRRAGVKENLAGLCLSTGLKSVFMGAETTTTFNDEESQLKHDWCSQTLSNYDHFNMLSSSKCLLTEHLSTVTWVSRCSYLCLLWDPPTLEIAQSYVAHDPLAIWIRSYSKKPKQMSWIHVNVTLEHAKV